MRMFLLAVTTLACIFAWGPTRSFEAEPTVEPVRFTPPAVRHPTELIDLDSLTLESDFTVFMAAGVPENVRNAALRRLWRMLHQEPEDQPWG